MWSKKKGKLEKDACVIRATLTSLVRGECDYNASTLDSIALTSPSRHQPRILNTPGKKNIKEIQVAEYREQPLHFIHFMKMEWILSIFEHSFLLPTTMGTYIVVWSVLRTYGLLDWDRVNRENWSFARWKECRDAEGRSLSLSLSLSWNYSNFPIEEPLRRVCPAPAQHSRLAHYTFGYYQLCSRSITCGSVMRQVFWSSPKDK